MKKSDFIYDLPESLIARYPLPERSASRMLIADGEALQDSNIKALPELLRPEDLLIFNNTKVMPARLFAQKSSGGKVEIMVERLLDAHHARAYLKASKTPKTGAMLHLKNHHIEVLGREEALFLLSSATPWHDLLHSEGELPIPPYFERRAEADDAERYQTVYAKHEGAVAAPTAGLHFDEALLAAIRARGVHCAELTLHVGAGTFQPVRHENLNEHVMHEERFEIPKTTLEALQRCRERGGRVVAVGTTSLRALETWAADGAAQTQDYQGSSRLFIYPPYAFQVVDALLTNFHLPESTLIMLVSAFLGYDNTRQAYAHAIAQGYRFYSYGDCMWLPRRQGSASALK